MAEEVVAWIGSEIIDMGAEWLALGSEIVSYAPAIATAIQVTAAVYTMREQQRRARSAYNNGLMDRYVMQRSATAQRQVVLGRVRVSGPITFLQSYGNNRTTLALCVTLAGHECDGIEDIFFNDTRVILDGSGNVVGTTNVEHFSISGTTATFNLGAVGTAGTASAVATYDTGDVSLAVVMSSDGKTLSVSGGTAGKVGSVLVTYQPYEVVYTPTRIQDTHQQQTASSSTGTFTVPSNCITASCVVVDINSAGAQTAIGFSRAGNVITYTGATAGHTVHLMYQAGTTYSRARVRKYLGGSGQTADSGLISNLPALWTSAHVGAGLCYLVVELDYDPSTFPNGLPNVSAVVRGLKCYDPRTSTTAWTDNPALLARAYYLHPLGGNRSTAEINDAAVIAAANVCDQTVTYTVGTHQQTRARYKASTVAARDRRPQDVLTDICAAMGGRWVISGNQLIVKAGAYSSPVASIDERWLHNGSAVSIQPRPNRADLANSIVGMFADEEQNWQPLNFPKVAPTAYITADGNELQAKIDYPAVTYSGQAQYLASCQIRHNRAGLTIKLSCNLRAFPLEVFDVVNVSLARFGWTNKTFEVVATGFSVEGLVEITLKEIDATIWALDAAYSATDYATKTALPSPWHLPVPALGTPASGTSYLLKQADGTITTRIYVPITALTDQAVLQGGRIEVAYSRVGDPDQAWYSVTVAGDATGAFLAGVQDASAYLIKARCRNALADGNWSTQIVHQVVGKTQPPSDVVGLGAVVIPGAVRVSWTQCPDVDYDYTVLRYGTSWAAGATLPFNRPGISFDWLWPASGSYTIWAAHVDTTGNFSGTPQSCTVTVDSSIYIGAGSITPSAGWLNSNITMNSDGTISGAGGGGATLQGMGLKTFRIIAQGYSASTSPATPGFYNADSGALLYGGTSTYTVLKVKRSDGSVYGVGTYSPLANPGTDPAAMAAALNAIGSDYVVVVYSYDEPQGSRLAGGLDAAMYRCGASRAVFGSPQFKYRSAYVLIGIAGCGEGNGAEAYQGAVDGDTNAWVDVAFALRGGNIVGVNAAYTPRTLADYNYTGDLAATRNIVTYSSSAPSSPVDGDLWVDTSGTYAVFKLRSGGAWVTGANALSAYNALSGRPVALADINTTESSKLAGIADNATRNVVTYSGSAPGSPVDGDLWVDTSGTYAVFKLRSGGAWVTGANALSAYNALSGKPVALADINTTESSKLAGIANNATRNYTYRQSGDPVSSPGGVVDGELWLDTGTGKAWQRVSGAWQPYVGNGSIDTSQLTTTAATDVAEFTFSTYSFSNIA